MHLVHYKKTYGSFAAAYDAAQPDSLAVVGIFLQEANGVTDSTFIDNLRLAAKELVENTQKTKKKKVTGLLAINCNTWFYGYVCLKPRKVITKGTCHNQIRPTNES